MITTTHCPGQAQKNYSKSFTPTTLAAIHPIPPMPLLVPYVPALLLPALLLL